MEEVKPDGADGGAEDNAPPSARYVGGGAQQETAQCGGCEHCKARINGNGRQQERGSVR